MKFLLNIFEELPQTKIIAQQLKNYTFPLALSGLSDIHKAHFIYSLFFKEKYPALVLVSNDSEAQKMFDCLNSMGLKVAVYPCKDFSFFDINGQSIEYEHKRLKILTQLLKKEIDVVISGIDAALQLTLPKETLEKLTFSLQVSQEIPIENVVNKLILCGYEKSEQVDGAGQFATRGGILDIFPVDSNFPYRIEFWGDEIDSISNFDPLTQRRTQNIDKISIGSAREVIITNPKELSVKINSLIRSLSLNKQIANERAISRLKNEQELLLSTGNLPMADKFINLIYDSKFTLFDFFDDKSPLFVSEIAKISDRLKGISWQWNEDFKIYLEDGILCNTLGEFTQDEIYFKNVLSQNKTVFLDLFPHNNYPFKDLNKFSIAATQVSPWDGKISTLEENLKCFSESKCKNTAIILAGNFKNALSVSGDLQKLNIKNECIENLENFQNGKIYLTSKCLPYGLSYPEINFYIFTCEYYSHINNNKKFKKKKRKNTKSLYSLEDIKVGDCVVHNLHGIGIFKGIHKVKMQDIEKDYIKIEYAKNDILYVPVTQLDMVDKYIGPKENIKINLNRLGSNEWQKSKTRAKLAAKNIAKDLIKLYSERMNTEGFAFSEDNELQHDFESHFEFEETEDQLRCIDEIKKDMQRNAPMDRLLCGDVGFGKTEVALRAAFKCIADSKQCAILAPTTILAWQHYQTILKRFESFPVKIELLSRFKTPKQQKTILKRLQAGDVDIVVGTHRLVQDDVKFRDLGLAIIDEEQRFGVKQKERFKALSKNIDVLTLSATPIPRTLNMAMSGIRDMSTLEESPQNRYPVQTYVLEHDPVIINEAIRKELRRGGQVYYLYNNVGNISYFAAKLQEQIPEAKIAIGHGKMSQKELSDIWEKVINHEVDIFVCTTIIETGVDIPNVNTLIIESADKMGLSQLHQLRGRVGRSSRRAYAYFTFKKNKALSEISQKRLSAIREFTQFGSGFKIAMRDLELRGAGNILSGQQHGHIADVGYDMYLKLLNEAVNEEKGISNPENSIDCLIDVQIAAYIPEQYIENINQRIDMYRKISDIRNEEDLNDVIDELIDRFSNPPKPVLNLVDIALIRSLASSFNVSEIKHQNSKVLLFGENIKKDFVDKLLIKFKDQISLKNRPKSHIIITLDAKKSLIDTLKNIFD